MQAVGVVYRRQLRFFSYGCFQEPADRYSPAPSAHGASRQLSPLLSSKLARGLSAEKLRSGVSFAALTAER